jgi:peptidoglycan/xylan/chitin deacetylase (PgdA/CDA1 family)
METKRILLVVVGVVTLGASWFTVENYTHDVPYHMQTPHTAAVVVTEQPFESFDTQEPSPQPASTTSTEPSPVRVPILVYHGVRTTMSSDSADVRQFNLSPLLLERQLAYLRDQEFTPITFAQLAEYFTNGNALPPRPIILSFDDGWKTQITEALPLLTKYGMVATFYIYPNVIGHEHYMDWEDVRTLVDAGMEIGSHSKGHQYMTKQGASALEEEIMGSKRTLEEYTGINVTTFAYPFGLSNEDVRDMVRDAGYTTGRALEPGTVQSPTHRYVLSSYLVRNDFSDFTYFIEDAP